MNYLGIDFGTKRIGLSFADELRIPTPLAPACGNTLAERLKHIRQAIEQRKIEAIVIGYPYNMDGSVSQKALEVDTFCKTLDKEFGLPIHKCDERLSSFQAETDNFDLKPKKKFKLSRHKKQRASGQLDSQAATIILRDFLEENPPLL